jgi:hypothetical protein
MVLALVVPGWRHAPQGECGEEAQDVLVRGGALVIWNVELAQYILAGMPGKCKELL